MKIKRIVTIVLLVFVVGSLAYMVATEQKTESSQEPDNPASGFQGQSVALGKPSITQQNKADPPIIATANEAQSMQLIVYYFHGDMRCPTCHKLESYAKEALDTYFAGEVASKNIVWKVVNIDKSENRHFIQDYKLVTKSVVLSELVDGKEVGWKNLDQIWQRVTDKNNYLEYIRENILKTLVGEDS